ALFQARAVLDRPAAVVALVDAYRRGENERQPEGGEEGHLARLGPQDVGLRQQRVEAGEVLLEARGEEDVHASAETIREPRLPHPVVELLGDLAPHPGDQAEAQAALLNQRPHPLEQRTGEVRLRTGAADGEGDERRPGLLLLGKVAEEVMDLASRLLAEDSLAVQPYEAARCRARASTAVRGRGVLFGTMLVGRCRCPWHYGFRHAGRCRCP